MIRLSRLGRDPAYRRYTLVSHTRFAEFFSLRYSLRKCIFFQGRLLQVS
jgi:hypothetical protein